MIKFIFVFSFLALGFYEDSVGATLVEVRSGDIAGARSVTTRMPLTKTKATLKREGDDFFDAGNYGEALPRLLASVELGSAMHKDSLAECYWRVKDYDNASHWYIAAVLDEADLNIDGDSTGFLKIKSMDAFEKLKEGKTPEAEAILSKVLAEGTPE